ncbi:MAG: 2-oxo acid dehydrogenase subunit E2 [Oscillochloris sp.]|nr:2-oxo acid dehydrogenase subunit E2 [Oscillochloris sp.]
MTVEVKMPQLGESVTEGTMGRWLKQPGEMVQKYEPLLEVITDKVDTELPSPGSGILSELLVSAGETVRVGTVLAHISTAESPLGLSQELTAQAALNGKKTFLSPVVARMVAEHSIEPSHIIGSGVDGRVTKHDVLRFLERTESGRLEAGDQEPGTEGSSSVAPIHTTDPTPRTPDLSFERVPLSPMRRAIAEHMERSVRTAPHVTAVIEVDLSRVVSHRAAHQAAFATQGVRLTFTPYFIQATLAGLRHAPVLNGSFSPEGIIRYRQMHIGLAVALDEGLIVPVVHNADEKNLLGLARMVNDLAERARTHRLQPAETQGGTFSITNHGITGSLFATPIINQPQAGILGVGAIMKRPVVVSQGEIDAIAIKPMCYLSLTFDHRIADGTTGDAFLTGAKDLLEHYQEP